MDRERAESGENTANQVVDARLSVAGQATTLSVAYLLSRGAGGVETLEFALTPLQSLRLARDLLTAVERCLTAQDELPKAPFATKRRVAE